MKKYLQPQAYTLIWVLCIIFSFSTDLTAQVGINTTSPGNGAMLDITSTDKGILIPNVALTATNASTPITPAPATSLLVYNTATAGSGSTAVAPGYYYWDGSQWVVITFKDGDFHEVGTSLPPDAITDDVFRTGKVAIGKTTASSALDVQDNTSANAASIATTGSTNALSVKVSGSNSGTSRGLYVDYVNNDSGSTDQYAISTYVRGGSGSGRRYGLYNNLNATAGSTRQLAGIYNKINTGAGTRWGVYNNLKGTEDGTRTGVYNDIGDDGAAGNGTHSGIINDVDGSGTGDKYGIQNQLGGNGDQYGTYNDINNTEAGKNGYGTFNDINSATGTNYAGWFDSYGTGGTYYAAVFNRGHVVANEASGDFDFRIEGQTDANLFFADASTDRVGIGTATPGYTLDVAGDINLTGTLRNTGGAYTYPDYVFETYYAGFSEYNKTYSLKSLKEVEAFLMKNNHLPNVQSRKEVMDNGWNVTEGIRDNLEKVEELFLHNIEASKKIETLEIENNQLKEQLDKAVDAIEALNKRLSELEKKS